MEMPEGWKRLYDQTVDILPDFGRLPITQIPEKVREQLELMKEMAEVINSHPAWTASEEEHHAWWDRANLVRKKFKEWK